MKLLARVRSGIGDFWRGLSIIFGKPAPGEGDRKLARASQIVVGQISVYGKDNVRRQVVKSIYNDLKRANKHGGKESVQAMIDNAVATPEYMQMLHKLNMDKSHLWGAAQEVMAGK